MRSWAFSKRCDSNVGSHRNIIKCDGRDVVVGTALPRVVETEAKSTCMPSIESNILPESAVLDVDGAIVDLHATNGEIPAGHRIVRLEHICT